MEESSLIKSGEVSFQVKSLLKTSWVSRFCMLHRKTSDSHAYMELFEDKQAFESYRLKNKKCDIKKIELQYVKGIRSSSESTSKGMEHQIEIRLKSQKHFLMFKRESDFDDWFVKLKSLVDNAERGSAEGSSSLSQELDDSDSDDDEVITLNQMYASTDQAQRFVVEVEQSDLAKLCGIEGKMTLLLGNTDLAFEDPVTKRVKYSFQIGWMRRFGKYKAQSFNFEMGRKCPNGEGTVTCKTESAKEIHKMVTQKSSSRSKTVIPHPHVEPENRDEAKTTRPSVSNVDEKQQEPAPRVQERQGGIGQPTCATNMVRKHPGKAKIPTLIPIVPQKIEEDKNPKSPNTPPTPVRRNSKPKLLRNSGKNSQNEDSKVPTLQDNGHVRPPSYKVAVGGDNFAKELEKKLHVANDEPVHNEDHGKGQDPVKKDSIKTKEDKKREKEEKKERERKEKEEKKERERKEKEMEKERKQQEKEEKKNSKKDKNRESDKHLETPKLRELSMRDRSNIYDEPELLTPPPVFEDSSLIYDEATSPVQINTGGPAMYAQSFKRSVHGTEKEYLYDEAVSPKSGRKSAPQLAVYTEPYSKKGGVSVQQEPVLYADVETVAKDAWKKKGRNEEEEIHEEDYSNIKSARQQMVQVPPPIPIKSYGDDDDDNNDDTYNTLDLKGTKPLTKSKPENLYGTASATKVGPLPKTVQVPEVDYPSDSEGESLPEENQYEDPQYEGYEAPEDIHQNSMKKSKVVESYTYEDAVVPTPVAKTSPPRKVRPKEVLYEEIP